MVLGIEDLEFNRDRSLVERLQLGDEDAFAELYRLHHDRLYGYCLYRLGEAHEAQDVVQEAFTRAWVNTPRIQGDLRFYPWLRTIAANLCTDVGRRRARVQPSPTLDAGLTDGGQERIVERVDIDLLEQAMSRLPERHRQVLEMREAHGLSYEQLAVRTGTSVGTVESLLWRARQGLKRQFAAVSGESVLAGFPVVGWLIRRGHATHARLAARVAHTNPNAISAVGGAVGGVAIGSVVVAALVVSGIGGSSGAPSSAGVRTDTPAATVSTAQSLIQLAAQPTLPIAAHVAATTSSTQFSGSASDPARPRSGSRTELTNPVQTNPAAARNEAQADPVRVSLNQITAGVDPQAVTTYVGGLLPPRPAIP